MLKRIVCNTNLRNCMLRSCDHCPTMNSLRTYLLELFNMHDIENLLCYQRQKDKNFYTMMQLNSTIEEFLDKVWKQAKFLCEHHYIKNSPGIELTNFKWFVKKPRCQRHQGPLQVQKFWGFVNCFCHVFCHLLNQRKSSTLKHAVVNNKFYNQNGIRNCQVI